MMKTVVALLVVIVGVVGSWLWFSQQSNPVTEEPVFCTADAMLCPDGTYVGRTGPNCEFVCPQVGTTTEVSLFYYNPAADQGPGGAQCSAEGLVEVKRAVPGNTTLAEVIDLLIKGELTADEEVAGVETEFPLPGLRIISAERVGSVVTLTFDDPQNQTSGGSCRTNVLWLQIEATAKAFSNASTVRFAPDELFQP